MLERKLNFAAIKNEFWGRPNSIKEKLELKKITRKKINEIQRLETEIQEVERLEIETIEDKLFNYLNM